MNGATRTACASRAVELHHAALSSAAGSAWAQLWQALRQPARPQPWAAAPDGGAAFDAYALPNPSLAELGIDRKVARTMEKQAQLCVASAAASLQQWPDRGAEALHRTGLYLGLPSIDEEVPPLAALQRFQAGQGSEPWLPIMLSETPPFSGLALLNSSACAHISGRHDLRGALAAFSPFCDAGLQALVEGVVSVAEGENRHALIGAVSPKLHPLLPAQYAHWGWQPPDDAAPGEGAAFLLACSPGSMATAAPAHDGSDPGPLRLVGHARGFIPPSAAEVNTPLAQLVRRALAMAGRELEDIGWILPAACLSAAAGDRQASALGTLFGCAAAALPLAHVERAIGILGPAEPLVHAGLAALALARRSRLVWNAESRRHDEQPMTEPTVLLTAWAPHGQCVVALLEREVP